MNTSPAAPRQQKCGVQCQGSLVLVSNLQLKMYSFLKGSGKKRKEHVKLLKKYKEIQVPVKFLPISSHSFHPIIRSPVTLFEALPHLSAVF